jgi:TusA-related sulfurtransferase
MIAPFELTPLYSVLGNQGFDHVSRQIPLGDWEILFTRRSGVMTAFVPPSCPPCSTVKTGLKEIIDVDARGLEPPQPMVKILEAVAELPAGAELRAHTERRPMHLYAQLAERGFTAESEVQNDGSYLTKIRRS